MPIIVSVIILVAFLGTSYNQPDIPKGELKIYPQMAGMEHLALHQNVKPESEAIFENVVRQKYDYSCGSAALATLLNYYLKERLSEQQIIQGLMQYGETDKIQQRRAFSLLDMKRFCEVLGYNASGYKAELDDLMALDKPAILPIEIFGYKHFVVYRGIHGNHVFCADPYRGNVSFTINQFLDLWSQNIVFVVTSDVVKTNALRLTNDDLRIIGFDVAKYAETVPIPSQTEKAQRDFEESLGKTVYKTLDVR